MSAALYHPEFGYYTNLHGFGADGDFITSPERHPAFGWLLGRRSRPFDPRAYFEFRLYKDFSGGITDQLYSHGSSLAHFYLDTFIPDETVADGGILVWQDGRENPDTLTCVSKFLDKQAQYTYSTTFGNSYGDHSIIRGTKGTLYSPGGEGSRWKYPHRWSPNGCRCPRR